MNCQYRAAFLPFLLLIVLSSLSLPESAFAASTEILADNVDLVWVSVCAALVFFMQAGFALLEGGSARSKNTINVVMKNYADLCFGLLVFWMLGYGLMFGTNASGFLGTDHFMFSHLDNKDAVFFVYQAMFAATAATIISGSVAERMRFWPYVIASMIVTAIIYPIFGSWTWGGYYGGSGWLNDLGFIDFAGSTVVHSIGGWCALAAIIVLGPRTGRFSRSGEARAIPGHSLPLVGLGVFILWLGWFGFNGGSTFSASADIGTVLLNTQLAAAGGVVGALLTMSFSSGPVLLTITISGALGGLVSITAGCLTMSAPFAILTGIIGGMVTVFGSALLKKLRLDDVVDAVPVHAFCGAWGTLAAGLFYSGDLFNIERISVQFIGISIALLWAFPLALLTFSLLKIVIGLRVSTQDEQRGLDYAEHYEQGYPEFQADLTNRHANQKI